MRWPCIAIGDVENLRRALECSICLPTSPVVLVGLSLRCQTEVSLPQASDDAACREGGRANVVA